MRVAASVDCHIRKLYSSYKYGSRGFANLTLCGSRQPTLRAANADVSYLLPEDVLREIFKYSMPPEYQIFSRHHWVHLGSRCILVLTHVCSRRRQIVLSMPYLWSTICVSEHKLRRPNAMHSMHERPSGAAAIPRSLFLALEQGRIRSDLDPIFASYPFQKLSAFRDNLEWSRVMSPHDAKLPDLQSLSILFEWGPGSFGHYSTAIPWSQIRRLTLSDISITTHLPAF